MLLPDVNDAGRIVFIDYRPSHPRYAMLQLATRGTCMLEVRRVEPVTGKGHRFEAVITGFDTDIVDAQLRTDLVGARQWLDEKANEYLREVRRLEIVRRALRDADEGCTLIRADVDKHLMRTAPKLFDEVR
jgi:hypothetical protein